MDIFYLIPDPASPLATAALALEINREHVRIKHLCPALFPPRSAEPYKCIAVSIPPSYIAASRPWRFILSSSQDGNVHLPLPDINDRIHLLFGFATPTDDGLNHPRLLVRNGGPATGKSAPVVHQALSPDGHLTQPLQLSQSTRYLGHLAHLRVAGYSFFVCWPGKSRTASEQRQHLEALRMINSVNPRELPEKTWLDTGHFLGSGQFGTVSLYRGSDKGALAACKTIDLGGKSAAQRDRYRAEVTLMKRLVHPNIVRYIHHEEGRSKSNALRGSTVLKVLMQPAHGTLSHLINSDRMRPHIGGLFLQSTSALAYLHSQDLSHRDLKPDNILFSLSGYGEFAFHDAFRIHEQDVLASLTFFLADFGFYKALGHGQATMLGTAQYMAPEITGTTSYTSAVDIYALGCTMTEVSAQSTFLELFDLYGTRFCTEMQQKLTRYRREVRMLAQRSGPECLRSTVVSMLDEDGDQRPTAIDLERLAQSLFSHDGLPASLKKSSILHASPREDSTCSSGSPMSGVIFTAEHSSEQCKPCEAYATPVDALVVDSSIIASTANNHVKRDQHLRAAGVVKTIRQDRYRPQRIPVPLEMQCLVPGNLGNHRQNPHALTDRAPAFKLGAAPVRPAFGTITACQGRLKAKPRESDRIFGAADDEHPVARLKAVAPATNIQAEASGSGGTKHARRDATTDFQAACILPPTVITLSRPPGLQNFAQSSLQPSAIAGGVLLRGPGASQRLDCSSNKMVATAPSVVAAATPGAYPKSSILDCGAAPSATMHAESAAITEPFSAVTASRGILKASSYLPRLPANPTLDHNSVYLAPVVDGEVHQAASDDALHSFCAIHGRFERSAVMSRDHHRKRRAQPASQLTSGRGRVERHSRDHRSSKRKAKTNKYYSKLTRMAADLRAWFSVTGGATSGSDNTEHALAASMRMPGAWVS